LPAEPVGKVGMALEAQRRVVIERGRGSTPTPTFAWWTGGPAEVGGSVFVSVTDFHLHRTGDLFRVYLAGLRLSRAWRSMNGAVGMWLWTKPLGKRSGSVSVWRSEEDLRRFVRWPRHLDLMRGYRDAGELTSTTWREPHFEATEIWARAAAQLSGVDPELADREGQACAR
jgi:hypothetical protein